MTLQEEDAAVDADAVALAAQRHGGQEPEGDVLADLLPQVARLFTQALWRAFAFDDLHGTSGGRQGVGRQLVPAEAGGYLVPI
ncbi:MAG: hypothetical protein CME15_03025 [Gemmatimonadetes bacterium]|nr:hypothetical protein [Gemmatimonadota bacterium]